MRVKIFEKCLSVSQGDYGGGSLIGIEQDINGWLAGNPDIEIIDIRFTASAAHVQDGPTNHNALCLVLYKDKT
jgi:hypothetical protein